MVLESVRGREVRWVFFAGLEVGDAMLCCRSDELGVTVLFAWHT